MKQHPPARSLKPLASSPEMTEGFTPVPLTPVATCHLEGTRHKLGTFSRRLFYSLEFFKIYAYKTNIITVYINIVIHVFLSVHKYI